MKGIAYMNKLQDKEYMRNVAQGLIEAVGGLVSEKSIDGVVSVFKGIEQGLTNNWEEHIAQKTNNILARDNIICECGAKILVTRTRQVVQVSTI